MDMDTETKAQRGIQSIEVGGAILVALAEAGEAMSLKDLAAAAAMAPAKAHPYLVSYGKLGLVRQDAISGRYELGPLALKIGLACLRRLNPVKVATAAAARLAERVQLTVALAVWGNAGPTIVHIEESSWPIHMNLRTGTVMSLNTATGRVFAAYLPAKMVERFADSAVRSPSFPEVAGGRSSWQAMQDELAEVRRHGMARAVGAPIPGVNAFSAPVFDHDGHLALVITILGPAGGFDPAWASVNARTLRETAEEVSHLLGSAPPPAAKAAGEAKPKTKTGARRGGVAA
jgi:DNA-binding IclR family transcriptional regulator